MKATPPTRTNRTARSFDTGFGRLAESRPGEPSAEHGLQRCHRLRTTVQRSSGAYLRTSVSAQNTLTEDQWSDLDFATQYIFNKWPALDERPRSSLEMAWSGMADKLLFNPFNRLFCSGKCTFTLRDTTHRNNIVICDFPLHGYGHETGRTINVILKLIFQRAWLRRNISESSNPVFLRQDEFQYFVTRRENFFQQTCRGSRVEPLTWNIAAGFTLIAGSVWVIFRW